jgi:hypothetical protein
VSLTLHTQSKVQIYTKGNRTHIERVARQTQQCARKTEGRRVEIESIFHSGDRVLATRSLCMRFALKNTLWRCGFLSLGALLINI